MKRIRWFVLFLFLLIAFFFYRSEKKLYHIRRMVKKVEKEAQVVSATRIDPKNEEKVVVVSAPLLSSQVLRQDPQTGYRFPLPVLSYKRVVSMFQWADEALEGEYIPKESAKERRLRQAMEKSFKIGRAWFSRPILSKRHMNPPFPWKNSVLPTRVQTKLRLGAFTLDASFLEQVFHDHEIQLTPETARGVKPEYRERIFDPQGSREPKVGDLQISYRVVPSKTMVTVMGLQVGKNIRAIPLYGHFQDLDTILNRMNQGPKETLQVIAETQGFVFEQVIAMGKQSKEEMVALLKARRSVASGIRRILYGLALLLTGIFIVRRKKNKKE